MYFAVFVIYLQIFIYTHIYPNILYAVTAVYDCDPFIKLQNVWFFHVCCFACDAIKFKKNTKHAPVD
jgi:hypothetical protein